MFGERIMLKKILAVITSLSMLMGSASYVCMADTQDTYKDASFIKMTQIDIEDDVADNYTNKTYLSAAKASVKYTTSWDKYSTNYFYNKLGAKKRAVYRDMMDACNKLLTTKKDATSISGYPVTPVVYCDKSLMTKSEVNKFELMFRYSNPQFFFLTSSYFCESVTVGTKKMWMIAFVVYDNFENGSTRYKAATKIKNKVTKWISNAKSKYTTDERRVKYFHNKIVNKIEYDYEFDAASSSERSDIEQKHYTQSVYSVFCKNISVCSGYSQALQMLCNGAGIDCLTVTSDYHAWNKVRINDAWYNIDATWDDSGYGYYYYVRSDYVYDHDDALGVKYHKEEPAWKNAPKCSFDSGSTIAHAGKAKVLSQSVDAPLIKAVKKSSGEYKVVIKTSDDAAKIYYTIDGIRPSCASTRSNIYKKALTLTKSELKSLRAIAIKNKYKDSKIATYG